MRNNILKNTLLIFLGTIIAFLFVPIFMITNSPEDFKFIDISIFYKTSIVYILIIGIVLSLFNAVLKLLKFDKASTFLIYFSLTWIVVSGFIFSISASTGMVDPENNPIDKLNTLIVLSVSILFAIISLFSFKKYIQLFLLIVVATSTIPAIYSMYEINKQKVSSKNHPSLQLSNKKNILVISFDGMPGEVVSDVIKNNDSYLNSMKDFTIFDNAVSQSPATAASLIGEIYGIQDYKSKGDTIAKAKETLKDEGLLLQTPGTHVKDSFQYGYGGYDIQDMVINSPAVKAQEESDTFDFFKYPMVRIFSSKILMLIDWQNNIAPYKQHMTSKSTVLDTVKKLENHKGADWDKAGILQLNLFNSFVSDISVVDKELSLRYMHLTFTHFPVDYDENCNYRSDDIDWYEDNQNEKGIKNQDICAIKTFISFLDKLKTLEIYDNSLIILKSDHGKPVTYFSTPPNNLKINNHGLWGYNRYRPTLMIKDFKSNNKQPIFKPELVLLNDIAKTICEKSNINSDCEKFNGVNLLGDSLQTDDPYYLYVVEDEKGSFTYDTHISVKIPSRKTSLLQAMENSPLISLSENKAVIVGKDAFNIRKVDLENIKIALEKYFKQNNSYPVSTSWDGIYTNWGASTPEYIKGLVPNFIKQLPIDPRNSNNGSENYLYMSNGKDFKFIVHSAPEYDIKRIDSEFIDPSRIGYAYGIWTDGAREW